jgi:sRNA-binding protein
MSTPDSSTPEAVAAPSVAEPAAAPVAEPVAEPAAAPAPQTAPEAAVEMTPAACAKLLKERFPALFDGPARPLKLRIQADIKERAPGLFTRPVLSAFLRRHTGSTAYLVALTQAAHRFDLDGQPAGEITAEHRAAAQEELDRRRALHQERRAQEAKQQREQQAQEARQAREQRAQQDEAHTLAEQQRRNRAYLLRDFEQTTLTRANFCTLKGVDEAKLDLLLDVARKERAEWLASRPATPPAEAGARPPRDAQRPGPRRDGRPPRREDGDRGPRRERDRPPRG